MCSIQPLVSAADGSGPISSYTQFDNEPDRNDYEYASINWTGNQDGHRANIWNGP